MMFMNGYGMTGWMWLMPVLTFVLFGGGIYYLAKGISAGARINESADESAMEILKKRYARGELSRSEFEQIKADL